MEKRAKILDLNGNNFYNSVDPQHECRPFWGENTLNFSWLPGRESGFFSFQKQKAVAKIWRFFLAGISS
ncbi:MAG TPA: hypothetical protein VHP63_06875 [candidate division Zixibacteria bacterium]|nr:hypothetical protein [candidate division Zixibacteria bacterium]